MFTIILVRYFLSLLLYFDPIMKISSHLIFSFLIILLLSCTTSTKTEIEFLESKIERRKKAPYSDAVRVGNLLFLTGQVGFNNDSLKLAHGGIKGETIQALENIKAVLEAHGSDLEHVAKCTVILTDANDFSAFNEIFRQYFPKNKPARTTLIANLVIDAKIEIEVTAVIK